MATGNDGDLNRTLPWTALAGNRLTMIDEVKNPRPDRDGLLDYLNVPHLRGLKSWDHGDKVVFTYGGVRVTVTK